MTLSLQVAACYEGDNQALPWRGTQITSADEFDTYLRGPVKARLGDSEPGQTFEEDLRALAATDMGISTVAQLLRATVAPLDWEVGEAVAECLLRDEYEVVWPWNEERDQKTPRASLPGADLVGFIGTDDDALLLFGEVKTSSSPSCPPNVLNGRTGLIVQIDELAKKQQIHRSLVKWLHARCKGTEFWPIYQSATRKYLESGGREMVLVGILLRDTPPNELDLKSRARALAASVSPPMRFRLDAWYLPRSCSAWVSVVTGGES